MSAGIIEPDGKRVGTSTIGAGLGGVVGYTLGGDFADIIVHAFPGAGPVEGSIANILNFLFFVLGIILGGKFTPSNQVRTIWGSSPYDVTTPPLGAVFDTTPEEPLEVALVAPEGAEGPEDVEDLDEPGDDEQRPEAGVQADDIRAELEQIQTGRPRSGSTQAGEVN